MKYVMWFLIQLVLIVLIGLTSLIYLLSTMLWNFSYKDLPFNGFNYYGVLGLVLFEGKMWEVSHLTGRYTPWNRFAGSVFNKPARSFSFEHWIHIKRLERKLKCQKRKRN